MQIGRVIGDVVATRKDARFDGITLLMVQPLDRQRRSSRPAADRGGLGGRRRRRARVLRPRQGSQLPLPSHRGARRCRHRRHHRSLDDGGAVILARVVGQVVSTMKRPQFEGATLLLVQPETPAWRGARRHAAGHRLGRRRGQRARDRGARRSRRRRGARQETVAGRRRDRRDRGRNRRGGRRIGGRSHHDGRRDRQLVRGAIARHLGDASNATPSAVAAAGPRYRRTDQFRALSPSTRC